jgi:hypothetical protein
MSAGDDGRGCPAPPDDDWLSRLLRPGGHEPRSAADRDVAALFAAVPQAEEPPPEALAWLTDAPLPEWPDGLADAGPPGGVSGCRRKRAGRARPYGGFP